MNEDITKAVDEEITVKEKTKRKSKPKSKKEIKEPKGRVKDPEAHYVENALIKYFKYSHLPEHLQAKSKPFHDLAVAMDKSLPNGSEKTAGLRKLLEAKDCFVRASI